MLKQLLDTEYKILRSGSGNDLNAKDGIPTELEEVVGAGHVPVAEEFAPEARDGVLGPGAEALL